MPLDKDKRVRSRVARRGPSHGERPPVALHKPPARRRPGRRTRPGKGVPLPTWRTTGQGAAIDSAGGARPLQTRSRRAGSCGTARRAVLNAEGRSGPCACHRGDGPELARAVAASLLLPARTSVARVASSWRPCPPGSRWRPKARSAPPCSAHGCPRLCANRRGRAEGRPGARRGLGGLDETSPSGAEIPHRDAPASRERVSPFEGGESTSRDGHGARDPPGCGPGAPSRTRAGRGAPQPGRPAIITR